ncbi:MAG: sigma-70 family RNA polymerase sigma factor [Steroidobacteraceae bacterium]
MSTSESHLTVESLYSDHHSWLRAWLRRRLGDSFAAADLTHDTFLRVLIRHPPSVIREPRALLTTIAKGLVLDRRRHQRIENAYLEALAQLPEPLVPSPEVQAMAIEALTEIDRKLDGLPWRARQAFLLSQLDGLKQSEIAAQLRLSIPTVRRYVASALEQFCFD